MRRNTVRSAFLEDRYFGDKSWWEEEMEDELDSDAISLEEYAFDQGYNTET